MSLNFNINAIQYLTKAAVMLTALNFSNNAYSTTNEETTPSTLNELLAVATHMAQHGPNILVLGAQPHESDHFTFGNQDNIMYMDLLNNGLFKDQVKQYNFIQGDFNDQTFLQSVSGIFGGYFNLITVDASVAPFLMLNLDRVNMFLNMLTNDGSFVLDFHNKQKVTYFKTKGVTRSNRVEVAKDFYSVKPDFFLPQCLIAPIGMPINDPAVDAQLFDIYQNYVFEWNVEYFPSCTFELKSGPIPYWKKGTVDEASDRNRWIDEGNAHQYLEITKINID